MFSLPSQKQLLRLAFAMLLMSSSVTHASQCVTDYLTAVLPKLEKEYAEVKSSLRIGSVQAERYVKPKSVTNWSLELRSSEVGEITGSDLPEGHWLSEWVQKIQDQGAELRLLEYEQKPRWYGKWEKTNRLGAYFAYDREKRVPYIAVSVRVTPDKLAHEFDHLEKWLALRNSLLDQGLQFRAANEGAYNHFTGNIVLRQKSERTAVGKELQLEGKLQRSVVQNNPIKWSYPSGALPFAELESLTRILIYPEAEAVKLALKKKDPEATPMMRALIRKALLLRLTSYQRAQEALAANPNLVTGIQLDMKNHLLYMQELQNLESFFDSLMLGVRGRFEVANVYDEARKLFEAELPSVWESLPVQKRGDFKPRFKTEQ